MKTKAVVKKAPEEITVAEETHTRDWLIPLVDITEDFEEIRVIVNIPGVLHEDIEVTFENEILRIAARVRPRREEGAEYLVREFTPTGYERTFRIGETIDVERIRAEYAQGVLTLHLSKNEAVKPRSIPITAK